MKGTAAGRTPWYEVVAKLTPLISSVMISGAIGYMTILSTQRLETRKLELSQADSLLKVLPTTRSENPSECLTAFEAFNGNDLNQRLIDIMLDIMEPCGRPKLIAIAHDRGIPSVTQRRARDALLKVPAWVYLRTSCRPGEPGCVQDQAACALSRKIQDYRRAEDDGNPPFSYRGPQQVDGDAPDITEVRYFSNSEQAEAEIVKTLFEQTISGGATLKWLPLMARPGTIEIWLPKNGGVIADSALVPVECMPRKVA